MDDIATPLDIQPFCAAGDGFRAKEFSKPFSRGDYTYATDGTIAVRVPRRADVAVSEVGDALPGLFIGVEAIECRPLARVELPKPKVETGSCRSCEGRGREHDCPDCQCICEDCNGSGIEERDTIASASVGIGKASISLANARRLLALSDVAIEEPSRKAGQMIRFRFAGGVGVVMLLSHNLNPHLDIVL